MKEFAIGDPARARPVTVHADFAHVTNPEASPNIFGIANEPSKAHARRVYPLLAESGFRFQRGTVHLNRLFDENFPDATLADWVNDTGGIRDPERWDWRPLSWLYAAREFGLRTQLNILQVPRWLSSNGNYTGLPIDWDAWDKVIREIVTRHANLVDSVDILNEPLTPSMLDIAGTSFRTSELAAAEIYFRTARVIRIHTPDIRIGGPGEDRRGGEFGSLGTILSDRRIPDDQIQFVSYHAYDPCPAEELRIDELERLFARTDRPRVPVYLNEWNHNYHGDTSAAEVVGDRAVAFTARTLLGLAGQPGLAGAAFMSALPGNVEIDADQNNPGLRMSQAIYDWHGDHATLWPQAAAFRLLSVDLGLGEGLFQSHPVVRRDEVISGSFTTPSGGRTTVIINEGTPADVWVHGIDAREVWLVHPDGSSRRLEPQAGPYLIPVHAVLGIRGQVG